MTALPAKICIAPDRHNRGWPRVALIMWTSESDQSRRFYVHAMGRREAGSNRLEVIEFRRRGDD
jgi:hypothetical protein